MKIELVQDCIAGCFEIDGQSVCDMSVEELKIAFSKMCDYIMHMQHDTHYDLQNALYYLMEIFAPCEHSEEACECCGDFIDTYILEL